MEQFKIIKTLGDFGYKGEELKLKAEQDGFTNFKGLRKDKLVELLQSH